MACHRQNFLPCMLNRVRTKDSAKQIYHDVLDAIAGRTHRRMQPCQVVIQIPSWDGDAQYERLAQSLNVIEVPCVGLQTPAFMMHGPLLNLPPWSSLRCITSNHLLPTSAKKEGILGSNIVAIWTISLPLLAIYISVACMRSCACRIYSDVFGCTYESAAGCLLCIHVLLCMLMCFYEREGLGRSH